jgi:diguanylate cyclase (GGDEF)-like protein
MADLHRQAWHDALTDLPNRRFLFEHLETVLGRVPDARQVAVLFVDLDGFKAVNDRFGHHSGDLLLRLVAERISAAIRPADVLTRFAGDEFVVVAEGVEAAAAADLARRVRGVLDAPFDLAGEQVHIGASVGLAMASGPDPHADQLLRAADASMYEVKRAGRSSARMGNRA